MVEIYHDAFPIQERESSQAILDMVETEAGFAMAARCGGTTCGIAIEHRLQHPAVVFLTYLATNPHVRAKKVGSGLFVYAWEIGCQQFENRGMSALGMLWEIEIPKLAAVPEDLLSRR